MCTGNLRSGTEAFWRGVRKQDPAARETARCYFAVIGCFIAGAALGGLLLPWMGRWTALAAVLLQLGAFLWMCLWNRTAVFRKFLQKTGSFCKKN